MQYILKKAVFSSPCESSSVAPNLFAWSIGNPPSISVNEILESNSNVSLSSQDKKQRILQRQQLLMDCEVNVLSNRPSANQTFQYNIYI